MKRVFGVCAFLLFGFLVTQTVYAGSLNVYEAQIVDAAKKTYEYKGKQYRAKDEYIDELVAYLSTDGVDLTADQRDEVLAIAFSSVESGVSDGYLAPVEDESASVSPTVSPTAANSQGTDTDTAGQDVADGDTQNNDSDVDMSTDTTDEGNTAVDTTDDADGNTSDDDSTEDSSTTVGDSSDTEGSATDPAASDTGAEEYTSPEELIKGVIQESEADISTEEASAEQESSIFDSMNNLDDTDHSVIKNTGFDFSSTVFIIVGMGILMLTAIIVTLRSNLFAHEDD